MKIKLIITLIALGLLALTGCEYRHYPSTEAVSLDSNPTPIATGFIATSPPEPTPIPKEQDSPDIPFISQSIDDNIITIDLPETFMLDNKMQSGSIFCASGMASTTQETNNYTLSILRFFQLEDANTSIEKLLEYDKSMETYIHSSQIEYKNIMSNMPFGDGIGHISKVVIGDRQKYTATLNVGEIYYKFIINSTGNYASDELAARILTSIQLDGQSAAQKAEQFSLYLADNIYYSQKIDGAYIPCPDNWYPAESLHFSVTNSILSMMNEDTQGTVTVRRYEKSDYSQIENHQDFYHYSVEDLLQRGFILRGDIPNIQQFAEDGKRTFVMFPSDIIIIHYHLEYDDAYYLIEMMYSGVDAQIIGHMLDMGQRFVAPGQDTKINISDRRSTALDVDWESRFYVIEHADGAMSMYGDYAYKKIYDFALPQRSTWPDEYQEIALRDKNEFLNKLIIEVTGLSESDLSFMDEGQKTMMVSCIFLYCHSQGMDVEDLLIAFEGAE